MVHLGLLGFFLFFLKLMFCYFLSFFLGFFGGLILLD